MERRNRDAMKRSAGIKNVLWRIRSSKRIFIITKHYKMNQPAGRWTAEQRWPALIETIIQFFKQKFLSRPRDQSKTFKKPVMFIP
jgi:hypothetical protein